MMSFRWAALLGFSLWVVVEYAAVTRASERADFSIGFTDVVMMIMSLGFGAAGLSISLWERMNAPVNTEVSTSMVLANVRYAVLRVLQLLVGAFLICLGAALLFVVVG